MRNIVILVLIFLSICLQSCDRPNKDITRYDIYRAEVRTHLNIRDSPSQSAELIGYINNGKLVKVIEINDGWARIILDNGQIGYVSSDYLVHEEQSSDPQSSDSNEGGDESDENVSQNRNAQVPDNGDIVANGSDHRGIATPDSISMSGPNVHFIGDSTILSATERWMIIEKLRTAGEYVFVVNTVDSVRADKLFDYSPNLLDELCNEMDSSMNWWQWLKSKLGGDSPSSHVILMSYIKDSSLLQAESNGTSLKYLKMTQPREYFKLQSDACSRPASAIIEMGLAIDKAGAEYDKRSWFVKGQINTGNIFENICEDWIVENILPRDSFWHDYLLGWIFALPLKFANLFFVCTDSYLLTLFLMMVIILSVDFLGKQAAFKINRLGMNRVGLFHKVLPLLSITVIFILWLCMLSLLVYMIPDMTTLTVLMESGFSEDVIMSANHSFSTYDMTKNWFLVIIFILGLFLTVWFNADYALNATLPSKIQRRLFFQNRESIKREVILSGQDFDEKRLDNSGTPFLDLLIESLGKEDVGKTIGLSMPLAFVFNGAFLLFASIYLWTKVLRRFLKIGIGVVSYRKMGLYR